MKTVAIIDADFIGRKKHRFPNLVCMKISTYYKLKGANVILKTDYNNLEQYDKVTISKVFIDTKIPFEDDCFVKTEANVADFYKDNPILKMPNVLYGGTGFYYDKSPKLPFNIEHLMPDYHLYDNVIDPKEKQYKYYTDYSIGFMTRGCIRKCKFCVNRGYNKCSLHSHINEFLDKERKYICLLDDNILACPDWKIVFDELIGTGKRFQFKQGCDERLLTDEKCEYLFNKSKWIGDYIFAFDNIKDKNIIENKLKMIRSHTDKICKFYCFCGFNHSDPGTYNDEFYRKDIQDLFERIKILMKYKCLPYIMRYKDCYTSPYSDFYTLISRWCNQPSFFKKMSIREFANKNQERTKIKCSSIRAIEKIEKEYPQIAYKYFDLKFSDL